MPEQPQTQKSPGEQGCIITVKEGPSINTCAPSANNAATLTTTTSEPDLKYVSSESLPSTSTSKRTSPASRQGSAKSKDSGLGGDAESEHIITEKSSPKLKHEADIPEERSEPDHDLAIDGKRMRTPGPMGHLKRSTIKLPPVYPRNKIMKDEAGNSIPLEAILQKRVKFADVLINELPTTSSIIKRPVSRGGVAFDILVGSSEVEKVKPAPGDMGWMAPACVRNYAKKQRHADAVTRAELEEKQRAAELRRKVKFVHMVHVLYVV